VFGTWSAALQAAGYQPARASWDRRSVVAALEGFADAHGRPPRLDELHAEHALPGPQTIRRHRGSLAAAFAAAGLAAPGKRRWDRTSAIAALRMFASENRHAPTRTQWRAAGGTERPKTATIERLFGSWSEALHAAALTQPRIEWKPEEIIAALRDWTVRHGQPPTQADWRSSDPTGARPSASVAAHRFGSWTAALGAADILAPSMRSWNRREVVEAMCAFAREHDRAPTSIDWRHSTTGHPGAGTVSKIFGSWSAGLIAAGLEPHLITWDRKQIIAALRAWTKLHDRPPRRSEWETRDPTHTRPTTKTVHNHFGSWQAALHAAKHTPTI
jgi:hypothetical protein